MRPGGGGEETLALSRRIDALERSVAEQRKQAAVMEARLAFKLDTVLKAVLGKDAPPAEPKAADLGVDVAAVEVVARLAPM